MSDVAEYINEMKRLHENAVKVQEILSKILDLDVSSYLWYASLEIGYNAANLRYSLMYSSHPKRIVEGMYFPERL